VSFQKELEDYLKGCEQNNENELRELRRALNQALLSLDKKLDSMTEKAHGIKDRCPHCRSTNTKGYGKNPKRSFCLDCKLAYVKERGALYYRKRNRDKILDLIVAIHSTNKRTSEIIRELNVSVQTYYKWKREIIFVFPQLEQKFKRGGQK